MVVVLHVVLVTYLIAVVGALQLDLHGERKALYSALGRRATGSQLNNTADVSYYAEIEVGGKQYTLLVDTGSSDLWISGHVPNSNQTQFSGGVDYAVGSVNGPIKTAEVVFVGYTIPNQAFLEIIPDSENQQDDGIIGLGPNDGSSVYQEMGSVAGAALIDRIFLQNLTTPNYLTFLLGRSEDPNDFYSGSLTIGQVIDGLQDVLKQPRLAVSAAADLQRSHQHFQVLLDADGVVGPDGKIIPVYTEVASTANRRQATVVIDTGFSLPQVPSSVAAAVYGRFADAQLVDIASVGEVWALPCHQEVNITFKFNGKSYPIHPLDATLDPTTIGLSRLVDSTNQTLCIGTFQPFSYNKGPNPDYDMVLGMAFLRNVYVLMDYGDFIIGSDKKDNPYLQFLSMTNPAEAHTDFVKVRLNGTDTTANQGILKRRGVRPLVYYIVIAIVVIFIVAAIGFSIIYRAKRNQKRATMGSDAASPSYSQTPGSYIITPPQPYHPQQPSYVGTLPPPHQVHIPQH